jgi:hypothetical protein
MGSSAATVAIESLFCTPPESAELLKKNVSPPDAVWHGIIRRAREEARSLFRLVGQQGQTARSIRGQIYIPPNAAREMFAFIEGHPDEGRWMLAAIEFRNRVLREFDALAESGEHADRIAEAEAEATRRTALVRPILPVLEELVVSAPLYSRAPLSGIAVDGAAELPEDSW